LYSLTFNYFFFIEVKQSPKKRACFFYFFKTIPDYDWAFFFSFFLLTNLFLGARLGNYSLLGIFRENNDAWLFLHAALSMRFDGRPSDRNQRISCNNIQALWFFKSWYSGFGSQLFDIWLGYVLFLKSCTLACVHGRVYIYLHWLGFGPMRSHPGTMLFLRMIFYS